MKKSGKSEFTGSIIGLFCIFVVLGVIYHFVLGHDLLNTVKLLAIQTILLIIVAVPVVVIVWLASFVISKFKQ
jgi:hypothetical protein